MTRIGTKGQVVIPKAMRDALGLRPGDDVAFRLEAGGVRIEPVATLEDMRGAFKGLGLLADLEAERRTERRRESTRR
ncbi:MAG: AbrB/MazE/SpoVT family DNA-binding domain-containing protein [Thermoleophilia bacterium]|jgi:AbrB family looped-hinge helix DNA binding protein